MSPSNFKIGSHEISKPGFGAMGMSFAYGPSDEDQCIATLKKAIEIGNTCWDTADMYGQGANEVLLGKVLKEGNNRDKVFVISKWGNRWGTDSKGNKIEMFVVDGSKEYHDQAIDASIERLGSAPDAWILHRIPKDVPIEESVKAMDDARKAGKCRYIGLSECSAETLRKAAKVAKIDFVETEYSPWTLDIEQNGVLAACKELGVIILAYSPLGRGFLTGRYRTYEDFAKDGDWRSRFPRFQKEVFDENFKVVLEFEKLAKQKGCTPAQLCLAWLMAQGDNIVPIPGTRSEGRLIENFKSRDVTLSAEELKELREVAEKHTPEGTRYAAPMMATLDT